MVGSVSLSTPQDTRSRPSRLRTAGASLLGPLLIVLAVLILLHEFVLGGRIGNGDPPTYWLPTWCYLGKSLAAGHIPAWNPYSMAGAPFAADPQSGWMYVPAMLLFTALRCDQAIRWMLVLQPLLAGLGIFAFLRTEGLSRVGATVGGVALGAGMAGSEITLSLPFAATLGWTAVVLAACSKLLRAETWPGRILWAALAALAWGQLAAAHFSVGWIMGTLGLAIYLIAKLATGLRSSGTGPGPPRRTAAGSVGVLLLSMAFLNLAYFLPRLEYLGRTSLGLGYANLQRTTLHLTGHDVLRLQHPPSGPTWPLKLATTPGAHVGALVLALAFAGWWSKRHRPLVVAFTVFGAICYVATQRIVAAHVPSFLRSSRLLDVYLHSPEWFGYEMLLAMAVLGAIGIEAWAEGRSGRDRVLMAAPGVVVWGLLPPVFGATPSQLLFLAGGAVVAGVLLWMAIRRPMLLALAPVVLAVELVTSGLVGYRTPPFAPLPSLLVALPTPTVDVAAYVTPGAIDRWLAAAPTGRTITLRLGGWLRNQADPQSTIFRVEQVQGYNPLALRRYWFFVRAMNAGPIDYNLSVLIHPTPTALDLLQVRYMVAPSWPLPGPPPAPVLSDGRLKVFQLPNAAPRASFVSSWRTVSDFDAALEAVAGRDFWPSVAVLEGTSHAPPSHPSLGAVAVIPRVPSRQLGPQAAALDVSAPGPGLVLIRTPYDTHWHATVDGRAAPILPADFVDQGVFVSRGRHHILLTYDDPWIGYGLAGSGVAVAGTAVGLVVAVRRGRRSRRRSRQEGTA